jgi:hypothetical protein
MTSAAKVFAGLLGAVIAVTSVTEVSAAKKPKKVSYEEAWALCKAELDREKIPGPMTSNDRYLRGGACMARHGYRF